MESTIKAPEFRTVPPERMNWLGERWEYSTKLTATGYARGLVDWQTRRPILRNVAGIARRYGPHRRDHDAHFVERRFCADGDCRGSVPQDENKEAPTVCGRGL